MTIPLSLVLDADTISKYVYHEHNSISQSLIELFNLPVRMIPRDGTIGLRHSALKAAAIALMLLCFNQVDLAEPSVRLVVPYPSGGFADRIARATAEQTARSLGTAIFVETVSGAGGMRGALEVARAAPDGTTLLIISPPNLAIAKALSPTLAIDPVASFTPIAHIGGPPFVLVSPQYRRPPANLSELAQPPALATYGSPGFGTLGNVLCAAISQEAGLPLRHVPYSKSMLPDLLGGHIDLGCLSLSTVMNEIADRRLFPLVIAGPVRRHNLPGVPTLAELGQEIPGTAWLAIVGPARMPPDVAAKLNAAIILVLAAPMVTNMLKQEFAEPLPLSPNELARLIEAEAARWPAIIARLPLHP